MAACLSRPVHGALAASFVLLATGCQSASDERAAAPHCRNSLSTLAPIVSTHHGDLPCYLPVRWLRPART